MLAAPSDYAVLGEALAVAVDILVLSGLALYVAFRVRETLRDEKGRGARAAKVGFLIGLLFLSGGVFYFFAAGLNQPTGSVPSTTNTSSPAAVSSTTTVAGAPASSTTTSLSTASGSPTSTVASTTAYTTTLVTSSAANTATSQVGMATPQCPGKVVAGQTFQCTIYIYNTGSSAFSSATLTSLGTFYQFAFVSCSESINGGPAVLVQVSNHTVSLGNVAPGTADLTLTVEAPKPERTTTTC